MNKEIERDNDMKEYFLYVLKEMCIKAGVDVARFETKPGPDGDIVEVTIHRYFSGPQTVCVEGGCSHHDAQGTHYQRSFGIKEKGSDVSYTSEPKTRKLFYSIISRRRTL